MWTVKSYVDRLFWTLWVRSYDLFWIHSSLRFKWNCYRFEMKLPLYEYNIHSKRSSCYNGLVMKKSHFSATLNHISCLHTVHVMSSHASERQRSFPSNKVTNHFKLMIMRFQKCLCCFKSIIAISSIQRITAKLRKNWVGITLMLSFHFMSTFWIKYCTPRSREGSCCKLRARVNVSLPPVEHTFCKTFSSIGKISTHL